MELRVQELWFSFRGRATRSDYCLRTWLPLTVLSLMLNKFALEASRQGEMSPAVIASLVFSLFAIWPSAAVAIKRLHDRGKPGWWLLLIFVPLIGAIYLLVEVGFLRGTVGGNRFGSDPLGGEAAMELDAE